MGVRDGSDPLLHEVGNSYLMLVNYYYGGATTYVETERIRRRGDSIMVRYGDEEITLPIDDLRVAQERWAADVFARKDGLYRVTLEDATRPISILWDTDLTFLKWPDGNKRRR